MNRKNLIGTGAAARIAGAARHLIVKTAGMLLIAGAILTLSACKEKSFFEMRGVVLRPSDLAIDWVQMAHENGVNTIGTHMVPSEVIAYLQSEKGQKFLADCKKYGIHVEHQLHAMNELLPRDLFDTDSTMFRMNEHGHRTNDYNLCVHSQRALDTVAANAVKYARLLPATNHRYYYWIYDNRPMCTCPSCAQYSESEQALIVENRMIKALRGIDPQAQLAHLCYLTTLSAPRKVKPAEGIFLEFAPYKRKYTKVLSEEFPNLLRHLEENLEVFPAETAVVLEYWLDAGMLSYGKKPIPKLPWNKTVYEQDIDLYAKFGIRNITAFGTGINANYVKMYGDDRTFLNEYGMGMKNYKPKP